MIGFVCYIVAILRMGFISSVSEQPNCFFLHLSFLLCLEMDLFPRFWKRKLAIVLYFLLMECVLRSGFIS